MLPLNVCHTSHLCVARDLYVRRIHATRTCEIFHARVCVCVCVCVVVVVMATHREAVEGRSVANAVVVEDCCFEGLEVNER